jgi:HD-like signal output (HDOD) protein
MVHLKRHASKKWVRLILLSTQCGGNPALIARLFTINHRDDIPVFLVYNQPEDITPVHRKGLKQLGIRVIKRDTLDKTKTRQLIGRHIVDAPTATETSKEEEVLTPQQVHGRILDDLETMKSLPPLPQVYEKVSALARDPSSHLRDWIKVIKVDPMTCATILRHTNSLSYGFKGEIIEIDRAIILLGKDTIEGLVASEAVRQSFTAIQEHGFVLEDFWMHNLAVGFAAYILSLPPNEAVPAGEKSAQFAALGLDDESVELLRQIDLPKRLDLDLTKESPFVGGIMHDIGKAVMAHSYPGLFPLLVTELKNKQWNCSMLSAEQEVAGGLTHTVVGEILMQKWAISDAICNGVLNHHHPEEGNSFAFLIGLADIIGQILYPFPKEAEYPLAAALEEGSLDQVQHFLPEGFFNTPLLRVEEFISLARAISPRVEFLTKKMRQSVQ